MSSQWHKFQWRRFIVLFVAGSLLLTGCQTNGRSAAEATPVGLRLKWLHQAQFAGFYAAEQAGYFAEEGLRVTLLEGGPGINSIESVVSGEADFGVAGPELILQERSKGTPIQAIATTYRRNPFILVALAESGISKPEDLIGKRVAIGGNTGELQVRAMMNFLGLDYSQVEVVPFSLDLAPFYAGEIDVVPAFSAGSLIPMQNSGREFNYIWPDDYGIHFYSDTIFATEKTIAERPELVSSFLRAVLRGHRMAVENPEKALEYSLVYLKDADPDVQSQMIAASMPLINTGEDELGWMEPKIWASMYEKLLAQGFLTDELDVQDAYTLEFLRSIYSSEQ